MPSLHSLLRPTRHFICFHPKLLDSPNISCTNLYPSVLLLIPSNKQHKMVSSSITTIEILESFLGDPMGSSNFVYSYFENNFHLPRKATLPKCKASGGIRVENGTHLLNQINWISWINADDQGPARELSLSLLPGSLLQPPTRYHA